MPPLDLTVAICTHNNAPLLARTIERLEAQRADGVAWEVLVVDNACTDGTGEVLRAAAARGRIPMLRVHLEERLGLLHARRAAFFEARADLIAFVDDDCLLDADWVGALARFARAHPAAGAIGGRVEVLWELEPSPIVVASRQLFAHQDKGPEAVRLPQRGAAQLVGAGLAVRKEALVRSRWLDRAQMPGRTGQALTSGDDDEMVLRIRAAGFELWYEPAMRLQHFIPARRMTREYLERLYPGVGATSPMVRLLRYGERPSNRELRRLVRRGIVAHWRSRLRALVRGLAGRHDAATLAHLDSLYWRAFFQSSLAQLRTPPSQRWDLGDLDAPR
jgi:GT2 family glycosyltransferase